MIPLGQVITFSVLFVFGITPAKSAFEGLDNFVYLSFLTHLTLVAGIIMLFSFVVTRVIRRFV